MPSFSSVRFVHASANAPGVDILMDNRIDVVVGANTVASGTLSVAPRRAYTVFARGLVGRASPDHSNLPSPLKLEELYRAKSCDSEREIKRDPRPPDVNESVMS